MNPDTGEPFQDKYGLPIIVDAKPPTVSGLALALGFSCRRDLNAYQGKGILHHDYAREGAVRSIRRGTPV